MQVKAVSICRKREGGEEVVASLIRGRLVHQPQQQQQRLWSATHLPTAARHHRTGRLSKGHFRVDAISLTEHSPHVTK